MIYDDPTGHFWNEIWGGIKKGAKTVAKVVSNVWDSAKEAASDTLGSVKKVSNNVSNSVNSVASSMTKKNVINMVSAVKSTISNNINNIKNILNGNKGFINSAASAIINAGADALGKPYEASKIIAPYTQTAMNVNKIANPLYWAFDYSTEKGWFSGAFDVGGFYRDDNKIYHAKQSGSLQSWKYAGYNNLYDGVFNCATSMNKDKYPARRVNGIWIRKNNL